MTSSRLQRLRAALGATAPGATLTFVISALLFFQTVTGAVAAAIIFGIAAVLFGVLAGPVIRRLGLYVAGTTFLFVSLGNYLPSAYRAHAAWVPAIAMAAWTPAAMRTGQVLLGLTWLAITPLPAFTRLVRTVAERLRLSRYPTALILAAFGIAPKMAAEFRCVRAALLVRLTVQPGIVAKIRFEWLFGRLALFAVLGRFFDNAARLAFSIALSTAQRPGVAPQCEVLADGEAIALEHGRTYTFVGTGREETACFAHGVAGFIPEFRPDLSSPFALRLRRGGDEIRKDRLRHGCAAFVSDNLWDSLPYPTGGDFVHVARLAADDLSRWLGFFGVDHLLQNDVSTLSGGERIRVALALALAQSKPLTVLLHVTSHLDSEMCARLQAWLAAPAALRDPAHDGMVVICESKPDILRDIGVPLLGWDARIVAGDGLADGGVPARDPAGAPVLTLRDVCIARGERAVVSHLSFDVRAREIVALTGHNGSGKSSVLLGIAGALPYAGCIAGAAKVGVAFQDAHAQLSGPTCADEIRIAAMEQEASCAMQARIVAQCAFADTTPQQLVMMLNDNQARLLSIASMTDHAGILLADEPTADVDALVAVKVMAKLRELAASGFGILLVSHDTWTLSFADREVRIQ